MRKYLLPVAVAAVLVGASGAIAATANSNFNAHVKLNATCIVSATTLEFGTLPGLIVGGETATSNVSVTCSKNTAYALSLSAGSGSMVGVTTPADTVSYSAAFAAATTGTGNGSAQAFTINGTLAAQATPSAQDYNETRTVTVTY
jgi:spore coat protein U-like protein